MCRLVQQYAAIFIDNTNANGPAAVISQGAGNRSA